MSPRTFIVIEHLTLPVALTTLGPMLCFSHQQQPLHVAYVSSTIWGQRLAALLLSFRFASRLSPLTFRFFDIRDESGYLIRLRVPYGDIIPLRKQILDDPLFSHVLREKGVRETGLFYYLQKKFLAFHFVLNTDSLLRVMALVHILKWCYKKENGHNHEDAHFILCVRPRIWMSYLQRYSLQWQVQCVETIPALGGWKEWVFKCWPKEHLRAWRRWWLARGSKFAPIQTQGPKINVDYAGHLNLTDHAKHSDVFFYHAGLIDGKDIAITFRLANDPLDDVKWTQIKKEGMVAFAIEPQATRITDVPLFQSWPKRSTPSLFIPEALEMSYPRETKWFHEVSEQFEGQVQYWEKYFRQTQTKIWITWYKYDSHHMILAEALRRIGGALAIYQRAFEEMPRPDTCVWSDIVFGFSYDGISLEREIGSTINHYVVCGYLGDYRFENVKPQAKKIRQELLAKGAKRILAYFDENSNDNAQWHTGHEPMRENYAFILERLIKDPQLGLVIKPKAPATLRRRLDQVDNMLQQALSTGRCILIDEGKVQGSYPPVLAALASDIAIHGHLSAATAGFEAALAGVKTLILDREGLPTSRLHALGSRVTFTSWDQLWQVLEDHWQKPGGLEGLGDWSSVLKVMDPYRDGQAVKRMSSYLQWALEGYKMQQSKAQALAYATERFQARWGKQSVVDIRG